MSAWIVSPLLVTVLVDGAIKFGVIEPEQAEKTGRMLTRANVRSIRARYGEDDEGAARVRPYRYPGPATGPRKVRVYPPGKQAAKLIEVDDVVLCKQVHHYDYQTCEYDDYETSPAGRFVAKMKAALEHVDRLSDAYNAAPWGL